MTKTTKRTLSLVLVIAMVFSLGIAALAANATAVEIQKNGAKVTTATVFKGKTIELSAAMSPSDADDSITWTSSNENVATVTGGTVTGVADGTATITAKAASGPEATCLVTVKTDTVKTVTIQGNGVVNGVAHIAPDSRLALTATATFESGATDNVIWSSNNISVANPDSNGAITGGALGVATITATSVTTPSKFASVTVYVTNVTSVNISSADGTNKVPVGSTLQMSKTIAPTDATTTNVTWKSSDNTIATITSEGLLTGKKAGPTSITCIADGVESAPISITVENVAATGVAIAPASAEVAVNSTVKLTATVTPDNATDKTVTWSVDDADKDLASVDQKGVVTGLQAGTATIIATATNGTTATTDDVTKTCEVTVTAAKPVTAVSIKAAATSISVKGTTQMTATFTPTDATNKTVEWKSSVPSVATVSTAGVVTGLKAGTTVITATATNGTTATTDDVTSTGVTITVKATSIAAAATVPAGGSALAMNGTNSYTATNVVSQITAANSSVSYIVFTNVTGTYGTFSGALKTNYYLSGSSISHTLLSSVTYTPGTTAGTDTFSFNAYDATSTTPIATGTLTFTVKDETVGTLDVYYNVKTSGTVNLDDASFANWFLSKNTNYASLTSVRFSSTPSSGTLRISTASTAGTSTDYYTADSAPTTSSKLLSSVYYKAGTATGAYPVSFSATGKNANGVAVTTTGTVYFCVTKAAVSDITYTAAYGVNTNLAESDFTSVFKTATGSTTASPKFSVRFITVPEYGTMYRYGTVSNTYKIAASKSTSYTVNSAATNKTDKSKIADVIYVPAALTTGAYSADYAVYDGSVLKYVGKVTFNYKNASSTITTYAEGHTFTVNDFVAAADTDPIVSVKFTQPTVGGRLYYGYAYGKGTAVTASDSFTTTTGGTITKVTYIPYASSKDNGTTDATIKYTGTTKSGKTITGTLVMDYTVRTSALKFTDVTDVWAVPAVDYCSTWGIAGGVGGSAFSPNGTMQRGMLVTMLYRMAGSPAVSSANPFKDVSSSDYYYAAVLWAYNQKIVTGTTTTTFSPKTPITRQDIASMLWRYAGSPASSVSYISNFTDAGSISNYAQTAMSWAVAQGIMGGDNGRLTPTATGTRAQVAAMLWRYLAK